LPNLLEFAWLIPVFPLASFVLIVFFINKNNTLSARTAIGAMFLSLLLSVAALVTLMISEVDPKHPFERVIAWLPTGDTVLNMGFMVDPLTAVMLMVVTFVGLNIFVYSQGYMRHTHKDSHGHVHTELDKRYARFFAYLSLFGFAMLTLVLANNLLLLFIAWELVGLCSYLLIGFWFDQSPAETVQCNDPKARAEAVRLLEAKTPYLQWPRALRERVLVLPYPPMASLKAFLTTRVGDVSFLLGVLLLYSQVGVLDFVSLFAKVEVLAHEQPTMLIIAACLIFGGAIGKSAQFPLHVWLPDAMAGPTPVSALIHAATMVAAGVYLVARTFPLFEAVAGQPAVTLVIVIGTITAILAALIALGSRDLKQVMAYSTISQLGYMMVGLGVGGVAVGMFHLVTHAFFKALLFLASGSVIHGAGTQNIYEMGGLRNKMPRTFWTLTIGAAALAGVPFITAGFWSKDEILLKALETQPIVFAVMYFAAFLTAFYSFRAVFVSFLGQGRDQHIYEHAHENPPVMTVPLMVLAFFAITLGWIGMPFANYFGKFLGEHVGEVEWELTLIMWGLSAVASLGGIGLAYLLYGRKQVASFEQDPLQRLGIVYTWIKDRFYFDELYSFIFIRPLLAITEVLKRFDMSVIDGAVNGAGWLTKAVFAEASRWFDVYIVDGAVNLAGWIPRQLGLLGRRFQTGYIQNYALVVFMGVLVFMVFYFYWI
jgi:NADH-quinone oxidoreductase subunit L